MKGVMVKNWIMSWIELRNVFLFGLAVQLICYLGLASGNNIYLSMMSPLMIVMYAISLMEVSGKNKSFEAFSDALPGGRKGMVFGTYLYILAFITAMIVIVILGNGLLATLFPGAIGMLRFIWMPVLIVLVPLLVLSAIYPVYFRFGYRIAKAIMLVVFVACLIYGRIISDVVAVSESTEWGSSLKSIWGLDLNVLMPWIPIILTSVIGLYFLSMLLSVRLYKSVER